METSTDGGATWTHKHVIPAGTVDLSGCTVRTDSNGVVYVFVMQFGTGMPGRGSHLMIKSSTEARPGPRHSRSGSPWTPASPPSSTALTRCVEDGVAGSRDDLSPAPSVDIANGAPTGSGATDDRPVLGRRA